MSRDRREMLSCGRRLIVIGRIVFCLAIFSCANGEVVAQDPLELLENSMVSVVEAVEPSVVSIARIPLENVGRMSNMGIGVDPGNPQSPDFVPNDFGAGVLIQTDNPKHPLLILTNQHVVSGGPIHGVDNGNHSSGLYIWIQKLPPFQARILASDPHSDLAVLTVDRRITTATKLKGLKVEAVDNFRKGSFVFAFGNPYAAARDGSPTVGFGIISNVARAPSPQDVTFETRLRRDTLHHFGTLLQISSRLQLGTSGGALLDRKGRLIGITTAMAAIDGYEQSAGYAIPFSAGITRIIDQLVQGHEVEYGFLGVSPGNATAMNMQGLQGGRHLAGAAVIQDVIRNSPAETDGLRPNDVVLSVNGVMVSNQYDLMREIALNGPWYAEAKNVARMKVWRRPEGQVSVNVRPGKWPVRSVGVSTSPRFPKWRGITVDFSTARSKYMSMTRNTALHQAVLVTGVDEEDKHEIQQGDFISSVNDQAVTTPSAFHAAIRKARGESVTLTLVDGRRVQIDR